MNNQRYIIIEDQIKFFPVFIVFFPISVTQSTSAIVVSLPTSFSSTLYSCSPPHTKNSPFGQLILTAVLGYVPYTLLRSSFKSLEAPGEHQTLSEVPLQCNSPINVNPSGHASLNTSRVACCEEIFGRGGTLGCWLYEKGLKITFRFYLKWREPVESFCELAIAWLKCA